jgi:glycosyltransferase involved in cell wall biosynthesis
LNTVRASRVIKTLQIVGDSKYGGATYLILEWCRYLQTAGCQVDVLTTDGVTARELSEIPGVNIIDSIYIPREISPLADVRALVQLLRLLRRRHYDVVHTYTATPGFVGRVAAFLAAVPVILHHQALWTVTDFSSAAQRLLYTPLEYVATLASTRGICVSNAAASHARSLHLAPQSRLVVIRNGIDPGPFTSEDARARLSVRRQFSIPNDDLLIGNVSRLAPQKDNQSLIRALVPLRSELGDRRFALLLVGEGPDRQLLEHLSMELGVSHQVYFAGFQEDVPRFLAALDVFINPSLWEGLSISLLEAMAAAKPIVTTNIEPNAELIEDEVTGLLVPPEAPDQLAQAVARFARDPALARRCAVAARHRVLRDFTIDRMLNETWDLYQCLLEDPQSAKAIRA